MSNKSSADHLDPASTISAKTTPDPSILTEAELATQPSGQDVATLPPVGTSKSISPASAIGTGSRIDEFQILRKLGQGAFATVYLARQETMRRLVALKLSSRISDEPQALSRLDHTKTSSEFMTNDVEPMIRLNCCIWNMFPAERCPTSWNGSKKMAGI